MTLWFCHRNPAGFSRRLTRFDLASSPCPAVMGGGIDGDNTSHYWLEDDGHSVNQEFPMDKPPYRVPSMAEIAALPWNGLTVASLFSGAGGSSLGYKMAGFRVLWANEFVPAAQQVYRLNHPGTILDTRDVRSIQPQDILDATGLAVGDLDVLDGSPPCASFSTAGKRHKSWGQVKSYSDVKQRTDDLFWEYARLLQGLQPKVFVAENVSGLVKGVAKGYFLDILKLLKGCGYQVQCRVLDAQWLGVPQMRQRAIFVGVRTDLGLPPAFPTPLSYRYSVAEALPWISQLIHDTGGFVRNKDVTDGQGPSVTVGVNSLNSTHYLVKWDEGERWHHEDVSDVPASPEQSRRAETLVIEGANGFNDHRGTSINRPMFTVQAGRPVHDTDISRYAIGQEWDRLQPGEQSTRYFQLVKADPASPCPTVTQRGGDVTTASVVHPTEKRKFTIAELKRICAFPDDFVLTGSYAQQWERLGRAVPPLMMRAIATVLRDEVFAQIPQG